MPISEKEITIREIAKNLITIYKSSDPFIIAEGLGIEVFLRELGSLKGFYTVQNDVAYIVINKDLDRISARIVCAHELGHDRLHKGLARTNILNDFELYLVDNKTELEANFFAANLLVSDDALLHVATRGYDIREAASELFVTTELLKLRLKNLPQTSK